MFVNQYSPERFCSVARIRSIDSSSVRQFLRAVSFICGLALISLASYGQDWDDDEEELAELYGDENIVSIASGTSQAIEKAPAVASVITANHIQAMGARDLDEVLQQIPGLHISRNSNGYNPIYIFRGVHSFFNPQVLMLINGIPITNIHFGNRGQSWGGMPVDAIARIEVIRGPGSALYGADAFSGVINIHTKDAKQITPGHHVRYGSFDTLDMTWMHKGNWRSVDIGLVVEYQKTDGHDGKIESDAQTLLDAVFGTSASLAPGEINLPRENVDVRLDASKDAWKFRVGLQKRRASGIGVGVAEALDPVNRYASNRWNADLTWADNHHDNWYSEVQFSVFDTSLKIKENQVVFPPGVDLGAGPYPEGFIGNPEVWERHHRWRWQSQYSGWSDHIVTIGSGYAYEDMYQVREMKNFGLDPLTGTQLPPDSPLVDVSDTDFVFLPEDARENVYFYVQDIWPLARDWELTAGIRFDHYSDFGDTVNPRLALVGAVAQDVNMKFLVGRAFRAPSFAETRGINNPVALGNPDLSPETMNSVEIAVDYQWRDDSSINMNLFDYRWNDIILYTLDAEGTSSTAQNAGEQSGRGLELEVNWRPNYIWGWKFNAAFVDADNSDTEEDIPFIPKQQAYVELDWRPVKTFQVLSQWHFVGDRQRAGSDIRDEIDDNFWWNLSVQFLPDMDWSVGLSVRNVLDEDLREPTPGTVVSNLPNDLPLAGRDLRIDLSLRY